MIATLISTREVEIHGPRIATHVQVLLEVTTKSTVRIVDDDGSTEQALGSSYLNLICPLSVMNNPSQVGFGGHGHETHILVQVLLNFSGNR